MKLRDHCVAIASVNHVVRTVEPGLGGEMTITGTATQEGRYVVILPKAGRDAYLHAFLSHQCGHWGEVDGKRYVLVGVSFHDLDGGVILQTY